MAYLIKTKKSPFWYLRSRDLDTGKWIERNLRLRHGDSKESARALKIAAKHTTNESIVGPSTGEGFCAWVPGYISSHYTSDSTRKRALYFWRNLWVWLSSQKIRHPRHLKYQHAREFMDWRIQAGSSHNTARGEVKFLSFLMKEAIRREYADRNVLGGEIIAKAPPKEKAELSDEDIHAIRLKFLAVRPEEKWCRAAQKWSHSEEVGIRSWRPDRKPAG